MLEELVTMPEDLIPPEGSDTRRVLNDHKYYILNHPTTMKVPLSESNAYPERHNFYAYCLTEKIEPILIYPMLLINEFNNPMEFDDKRDYLLKPTVKLISEILDTIIHN